MLPCYGDRLPWSSAVRRWPARRCGPGRTPGGVGWLGCGRLPCRGRSDRRRGWVIPGVAVGCPGGWGRWSRCRRRAGRHRGVRRGVGGGVGGGAPVDDLVWSAVLWLDPEVEGQGRHHCAGNDRAAEGGERRPWRFRSSRFGNGPPHGASCCQITDGQGHTTNLSVFRRETAIASSHRATHDLCGRRCSPATHRGTPTCWGRVDHPGPAAWARRRYRRLP